MRTLIIPAIMLLGLLTMGCQQDFMPVTTSSEKALQAFHEGRNLVEKLRAREAYDYFAEAVRLDTNFVLAYTNLAVVSPTQKEQHIWLQKVREKLDLVSDGERYYCLGVEAGYMGMGGKQREYFQILAKMYPKDVQVQVLLGNLYFGNQEFDLAIAQYTLATKLDPDYSISYNQLGYCYRFQGDYARAESAFKKYISLIPDDPNPYDSYAELLLQMGEYEVSIEMYEKAIAINEGFVNSYLGIATNLNLREEHDLARKKLKDIYYSIDNDGQRRQTLAAIAISFIDEGRYDQALKILEKQFGISANNQDTLGMANDNNLMGFVRYEAGEYEAAEAIWKQNSDLIQASELSEVMKSNWARIYLFNQTKTALAKNDLNAALNFALEYQKVAEKGDNFMQIRAAHELFGLIYIAEKKYEQAIQELMQSNLQNIQNVYRLATAYEGLNDKPMALEYYQRAAFANAFNNITYAFVRHKALDKYNLLKR